MSSKTSVAASGGLAVKRMYPVDWIYGVPLNDTDPHAPHERQSLEEALYSVWKQQQSEQQSQEHMVAENNPLSPDEAGKPGFNPIDETKLTELFDRQLEIMTQMHGFLVGGNKSISLAARQTLACAVDCLKKSLEKTKRLTFAARCLSSPEEDEIPNSDFHWDIWFAPTQANADLDKTSYALDDLQSSETTKTTAANTMMTPGNSRAEEVSIEKPLSLPTSAPPADLVPPPPPEPVPSLSKTAMTMKTPSIPANGGKKKLQLTVRSTAGGGSSSGSNSEAHSRSSSVHSEAAVATIEKENLVEQPPADPITVRKIVASKSITAGVRKSTTKNVAVSGSTAAASVMPPPPPPPPAIPRQSLVSHNKPTKPMCAEPPSFSIYKDESLIQAPPPNIPKPNTFVQAPSFSIFQDESSAALPQPPTANGKAFAVQKPAPAVEPPSFSIFRDESSCQVVMPPPPPPPVLVKPTLLLSKKPAPVAEPPSFSIYKDESCQNSVAIPAPLRKPLARPAAQLPSFSIYKDESCQNSVALPTAIAVPPPRKSLAQQPAAAQLPSFSIFKDDENENASIQQKSSASAVVVALEQVMQEEHNSNTSDNRIGESYSKDILAAKKANVAAALQAASTSTVPSAAAVAATRNTEPLAAAAPAESHTTTTTTSKRFHTFKNRRISIPRYSLNDTMSTFAPPPPTSAGPVNPPVPSAVDVETLFFQYDKENFVGAAAQRLSTRVALSTSTKPSPPQDAVSNAAVAMPPPPPPPPPTMKTVNFSDAVIKTSSQSPVGLVDNEQPLISRASSIEANKKNEPENEAPAVVYKPSASRRRTPYPLPMLKQTLLPKTDNVEEGDNEDAQHEDSFVELDAEIEYANDDEKPMDAPNDKTLPADEDKPEQPLIVAEEPVTLPDATPALLPRPLSRGRHGTPFVRLGGASDELNISPIVVVEAEKKMVETKVVAQFKNPLPPPPLPPPPVAAAAIQPVVENNKPVFQRPAAAVVPPSPIRPAAAAAATAVAFMGDSKQRRNHRRRSSSTVFQDAAQRRISTTIMDYSVFMAGLTTGAVASTPMIMPNNNADVAEAENENENDNEFDDEEPQQVVVPKLGARTAPPGGAGGDAPHKQHTKRVLTAGVQQPPRRASYFGPQIQVPPPEKAAVPRYAEENESYDDDGRLSPIKEASREQTTTSSASTTSSHACHTATGGTSSRCQSRILPLSMHQPSSNLTQYMQNMCIAASSPPVAAEIEHHQSPPPLPPAEVAEEEEDSTSLQTVIDPFDPEQLKQWQLQIMPRISEQNVVPVVHVQQTPQKSTNVDVFNPENDVKAIQFPDGRIFTLKLPEIARSESETSLVYRLFNAAEKDDDDENFVAKIILRPLEYRWWELFINVEIQSRLQQTDDELLNFFALARLAHELPDPTRGYVMCIPYSSGGTLSHVLHAFTHYVVTPQLLALKYAIDLMRGVSALHAVNIIHADLSPDNVLCCNRAAIDQLINNESESESDYEQVIRQFIRLPTLKICDFSRSIDLNLLAPTSAKLWTSLRFGEVYENEYLYEELLLQRSTPWTFQLDLLGLLSLLHKILFAGNDVQFTVVSNDENGDKIPVFQCFEEAEKLKKPVDPIWSEMFCVLLYAILNDDDDDAGDDESTHFDFAFWIERFEQVAFELMLKSEPEELSRVFGSRPKK